MEKETGPSELYTDGFNSGYVLQNLAPELAEAFSMIETNDEYLQGLQDGRWEAVTERNAETLRGLEELRGEPGRADELEL